MTTLINKESTQHYANKMVLAENRKVGSKSLPTALNEIDALIDEMKTYFDAEYGSALDMKLENNKNVFNVGTGTNIDKRSEVENSFTDVELNGNSLVNLFTTTQNFVAAGNNIARNGFVITLSNTSGWAKIGNRLNLKPNTTYYTQITCENKSNNTCSSYIRFSHDINYSTGINIPQFPANSTTTQSSVFTTDDTGLVLLSVERGQGTNESIFYDIILLEGNWTNKPIPQYFQGLKSIGEKEDGNHKISISSTGKNLFDICSVPTKSVGTSFEKDKNSIVVTTTNDSTNYANVSFKIPLKPLLGKRISGKATIEVIQGNVNSAIVCSYEVTKGNYRYLTFSNTPASQTIPSNCYSDYLNVQLTNHNRAEVGVGKVKYSNIQIEINDLSTDYESHKEDKKEISLNEPLRGLPNGTRDTIEKINGEWKIVRRCGIRTVNGSEKWAGNITEQTTDIVSSYFMDEQSLPYSALLSDKQASLTKNEWNNCSVEGIFKGDGGIGIAIKKSRLSEVSITALKQWIKSNPFEVIFELATPIIEDISPVTLQCWKNGTISIDDVLPVETNHIVALNKSAQIKNNIKELTTLRKRVEDLENFYDKIALEQAYQLDLVNHSYELDYNR